MELDLTPYDKALIIRIIAARPIGLVETLEEAEMLLEFCDLLEHCDNVGSTLHIN